MLRDTLKALLAESGFFQDFTVFQEDIGKGDTACESGRLAKKRLKEQRLLGFSKSRT